MASQDYHLLAANVVKSVFLIMDSFQVNVDKKKNLEVPRSFCKKSLRSVYRSIDYY